jgi:hypothetical protein
MGVFITITITITITGGGGQAAEGGRPGGASLPTEAGSWRLKVGTGGSPVRLGTGSGARTRGPRVPINGGGRPGGASLPWDLASCLGPRLLWSSRN